MCLDCAPRLSLQTSYSYPRDTKPHTFWLCASQTTLLWMYPAKKILTSWRIFVQDLTLQLSTVAGWKQYSNYSMPGPVSCNHCTTQACHFQSWWSVFCKYYQATINSMTITRDLLVTCSKSFSWSFQISVSHSFYKPSFAWTHILCSTTIGLRY